MNAIELKESFKSYNRDYFSLESCILMLEDIIETEAYKKYGADVIGLCGSYTEYESRKEAKKDRVNLEDAYIRDIGNGRVLVLEYPYEMNF